MIATMPSRPSPRSAFGTPLVPPDMLTHDERVDLIQAAIPGLRTGEMPNYTRQWLADAFESWLREDGDLERHLGLRPERGSRRRAPSVYAMQRQDVWLIALSNLIGSDAGALRVLAGQIPCPGRARELYDQRAMFRPPRSAKGFSRARARLSRDGS